ncbi:terminase small subunit [Sinorhizobium meliloti]|uniref:terminase small subunit n=1 Tax=Rhizobium meliloti TaxID=382 RepID=UPI000FD78745|nr:terminase small subunit [Sinorhizobium meliloti]RVG81336.1 terminase small subunit [Sinorhizobium meliloti]RVI36954.1 terminase small subunit [Sinorhizobium meliloti]RVI47064.1 terminase small subunit [Sinorhizobium meliloti]RVJ23900.1 terminase small subunit [Sinorhizobium meliloti]RVJ94803.1 terminase small subunit [Sinorhizobium meliloti]
MPVLKNARHEKFAQELAKGKTADEAYQLAGFKPNRGNAARLNANESIQARVAEIQGKGALKAEATVERVLKELSRIGFSDLRRVFDANGRLLRPEEWDDDTAAAVASVEVVTRNIGDGEVEHVHKIKVWDKNSALEKLAKYLGMFIERVEHSGSMSLNVLPEDAEL